MWQVLSVVLSSTTRVDYNVAGPVSCFQLSSTTRVDYNVAGPVSCFVIDN